jgi:FlaG/FlaF family flagellin (archaellin)
MHSIYDLLASVLRGALKIALLVFSAMVIAGILLIGIGVALLALIWSLLTGRKPAAWQTFTRFRQTSQQFRAGAWSSTAGQSSRPSANETDVVDVQAHEVRSTLDDHR